MKLEFSNSVAEVTLYGLTARQLADASDAVKVALAPFLVLQKQNEVDQIQRRLDTEELSSLTRAHLQRDLMRAEKALDRQKQVAAGFAPAEAPRPGLTGEATQADAAADLASPSEGPESPEASELEGGQA